MIKNNNAHSRVVLKMSHISADKLLAQLNNALKYLRAFEGVDSLEYSECLALINQIEKHNSSDVRIGDRQCVINVGMPSRMNIEKIDSSVSADC